MSEEGKNTPKTTNRRTTSPRYTWRDYQLQRPEVYKLDTVFPTIFDPGDIDPKDELSIHTAVRKLIDKMSETDERFSLLTNEFRNGACKKYEGLYEYIKKKGTQMIVAR